MRQRKELHRIGRVGWLRAAVLGANDGILSTASLVLGVATSHASHSNVIVAGVAGLVAGSMSMAAGEYVSVHSQADTERAELELERHELKTDNRGEHKELAEIYVERGLDAALAKQVAQQLMAHDALEAHARDELGITTTNKPRPIQAALASAASFAVGAALPLAVAALTPGDDVVVSGGGHFTDISRRVGSARGESWWCASVGRRTASDILGSAGHGRNRRGWRLVRSRRIKLHWPRSRLIASICGEDFHGSFQRSAA